METILKLKELSIAISEYLAKSGLKLESPITLDVLHDATENGVLLNTVKSTEEIDTIIEKTSKLAIGVNMFVQNVENSQLKSIATETLLSFNESDKKDLFDGPSTKKSILYFQFAKRFQSALFNASSAGILKPKKSICRSDLHKIRTDQFSTKTADCLSGAEVYSMLDLLVHVSDNGFDSLKKIRNFGEKSLLEVQSYFKLYDLHQYL